MKTSIVLLLFSSSLLAQVRSDLETVRAFERHTKRLSAAIDSAKTVQECADIRVSIEELRFEFGEDKELLDKSLYGENFDQRLERISGQLLLAERKLGVIESQIARIVDLETQVRDLSARVEQLSSENTKLLSDVDRLGENIKGLSASGVESSTMVDSLRDVIGRLQKGLRERDEMIFALVDSLFLQYDKDIATATEVEMRGIAIKLDRNNVVSGVVRSIENNIRFLERAEVSGSDLATILNEHARFSSQWKGIGPKLASIYASRKNRARELAEIDTLLAAWSAKADEAQWRGLNTAFMRTGISVQSFSTGSEFVQSVALFIDAEMNSDASDMMKDSTWARFETLWTAELAASWIPLLVERGSMTTAESTLLQEKVAAWRSEMEPTSPFVYALIFIAVVSLLAVGYVRFLRNKPLSA